MKSLRGRKVLVTGADGFIGSHLVEKLVDKGARVRALVYYNSWGSFGHLEDIDHVEKKCEVVVGDIKDPHFCLKLLDSQEVIFHLAALIAIPYSYIASASFFETNVLGTLNLLEAARRSRKVEMFVNTSTSETYGSALYSPMDEKHDLQAQSPYAASKVGADKAALSYFLSFGTPVTVVRPFNTYGPRQSARAVIPTIITQLLSKKVKKVRLGSLDPVRDYTYVTDMVGAFVKIALNQRALGEVVNVGYGKGYSIGETYKLAQRILGIQKELVIDKERMRPKESEVWKLVCDNRKVKRLTNWKPRTDFRKGLSLTSEWIRENSQKYKPEIYII